MLNLVVIRHAIAQDREAAAGCGVADEDRPLTEEGRRRMERAAEGLRCLVPELGLLATSPLRRAAQTAAILARAYGISPHETRLLSPGAPGGGLLDWVWEHASGGDTVAVVGHEPDLSEWVSWLLTGSDRPVLRLKKGGACRLVFSGRPEPGQGVLHWLLTPRQLRALGGSR